MSYRILFNHYNIVHIHTASGITFLRESIFLYLASFLGAKTILHTHSGSLKEFYEAHPKLMRKSLNKADVVVTIAEVWKKFLEKKGHRNVVVIGNPITSPAPSQKTESDIINVLFLGLISDNKGIWDIIEMVNEHREKLKGRILLRIGGNGEVTKLKKYISDNNLTGLIEYVGWIDGDKKRQILSNTDIYLQPSYREALGIAILEAMSYKIPIIATDTGGIPEIVHDGENGFLINPGDKTAMFLSLEKLIESDELRKKMGEEGYRIAQTFYPEAVKTKLTALYSNL